MNPYDRIIQIETLETLQRLKLDEDFKAFLDGMTARHNELQVAHDNADFTKPIPAAHIQGRLLELKNLLATLDTCETVVKHLHSANRMAPKAVVGSAPSRNPVSEAIPPEHRS